MANFAIHAQLRADCHQLGRMGVCHLLLNRNAMVPWFILVPECEGGDILDLDTDERNLVMTEAALVARFVKAHFALAKINFAAIGNVVPQLHIHVIGRSPDDPCWPAPVWGNLQAMRDYSSQELAVIREQLARQHILRRAG